MCTLIKIFENKKYCELLKKHILTNHQLSTSVESIIIEMYGLCIDNLLFFITGIFNQSFNLYDWISYKTAY